ncbi:MAG TPA: ORF6N domain-containing protein [Desulfomonilia bacterium]|nr:ORF6N domain-containing protein [Desulfomonilia bacterium]
MKSPENQVIRFGAIDERILFIRGEKVLIDSDLAELYGVPTKRLNEQVKRNKERFPPDFMFQLTPEEKDELLESRPHLSSLKYSKTLPYAFTEHGSIMAAGVLNSSRAIEVSVFIVRAFVKLRKIITEHKDLAGRITRAEKRLAEHDDKILSMVNLMKQLTRTAPARKKPRIGFIPDES